MVSLHLGDRPELSIIGERELGLMKPGSLLINAGAARWSMRRRCAALDSGIWAGSDWTSTRRSRCHLTRRSAGRKQVVLTPHNADSTPEGLDFLNEGAVENAIAFLGGRSPQNVVNP